MSVNLAGPAYRVTVPACILVATLRLKLKQEAKQKAEREARLKLEQEAKLKAERERLEQAKRLAKQKAEREANKTKKIVVSSYYLSHLSSYFSCFFHQRKTPIKQ